ncbi:MAG: GAF domain-containing protein, partial [Vicinamibacterales bacterium]
MDASHHANRQAVAGLLRDHVEPIQSVWRQLITEQSAFGADVPPDLLRDYILGLAQFIPIGDPAIPATVATAWCSAMEPTTVGVVSTAVAMGLLGEAIRLGLPDPGSPATEETFTLACMVLPDFSAEFVRELMRTGDMPPGEQHWYEVSQELAAERAHRVKQLAILNDVSAALAATLSLDDLYEIIRSQCGRLVDTSNFYIATLGPGPGEMTMQLHYFNGVRDPDRERVAVKMGLTKDVVLAGEPIVVDDYIAVCRERGIPITGGIDQDKTLAWLGAPIIAGNKPIGLLVSMTEAGRFDRDDVDILAAVARQAGAAMENARLFQAERNQAGQLKAINQISRAISTIREPVALMQTSCDLIREMFGYSVVSILLAHPDNDLLILRTQSGLEHNDVIGYTQKIGGPGLISHAAVTRQPVLVNDVTNDPRYVVTPQTTHIRSEVSIPLLRDGRLVGILDTQSPKLDAFCQDDVDLLTTIAEQLTV